ncbi:hypothetical protein OIO90_003373 [Microbotryomycetes sp. JL221]|nr:hypothetical protein OIO90_003373 [Microbotryomycetes sp. JL221]
MSLSLSSLQQTTELSSINGRSGSGCDQVDGSISPRRATITSTTTAGVLSDKSNVVLSSSNSPHHQLDTRKSSGERFMRPRDWNASPSQSPATAASSASRAAASDAPGFLAQQQHPSFRPLTTSTATTTTTTTAGAGSALDGRPNLQLVMPTSASRSSTAASFNNKQHHVGLGLMHLPTMTSQHDEYGSTTPSSGLSSTRSSLDSIDSGFSSQQQQRRVLASARQLDQLDTIDGQDMTLTLSSQAPVDVFNNKLQPRSPAALSSATATSPTIASRRTGGEHQLARLSTTTSPLLSPSPANGAGATTLSPRLGAPSSIIRSPSPSHGVYTMATTGASPRVVPGSATATPTRPTSFIGSITGSVGSVAMDRTSSASKSRDVHNRQQSLTSACPPVTSSFNNAIGSSPQEKQNASAFTSMMRSGSSGGSPNRQEAAWRWSRSRASAADGSNSARNSDDDEDPREGAKAHLGAPSPSKLDSLLSLPSNLLALVLAPLINHGAPQPAYAASPALTSTPTVGGAGVTSSLSSSKSPKRYPLALRLVVLSYLVFSVLSFGLHLQRAFLGDATAFNTRRKVDVGSSISKIEPRATQHVMGRVTATDRVEDNASTFPLGSMRKANLGHWAHKVAEGVRWGRGSVQAEEQAELEQLTNQVDIAKVDEDQIVQTINEWGIVRRMSTPADTKPGDADSNPLTPYTHTYRFSKMHDKLHWDVHDEIVPFAFSATAVPAPKDVTACLYSNEAWLSTLGSFVAAWQGPVSLVFETTHSRTSAERANLMLQIQAIREADELVRRHVDFHVIGAPKSTKPRALNKLRQRMIEHPLAQNYQINLARFFAPTDVIFVVADPRVVPSAGLKSRLSDDTIRRVVIERGDIVAVPTFGFVRDPTGDTTEPKFPTLDDLRTRAGLPRSSQPQMGVTNEEFEMLATHNVLALHETLPVPASAWPTRKHSLVGQVSTRRATPDSPTTARLAMFDRKWVNNHGPTNWHLWRKQTTDKHLEDEAELGGGLGLGLDGQIGGGRDLYKVVDYDMHYSPMVVMSRQGQPWCTERFEQMHAACIYQMYLTGAEVWVVPDEWTFTLEVIEPKHDGWQEDAADKLKNSISARLFGKFHQEACMHYGREFLSMGTWDSEKAQHLRETCVGTLNTWGMGLAPPPTPSETS